MSLATALLTRTAFDLIISARRYVNIFLEDLTSDDWFWQPAGGLTHIAWQVGHLATAQYALALRRIRGEQPGDEALLSKKICAQFGKNSTPNRKWEDHPSIETLSLTLARVHREVQQVLANYDDQTLAASTDPPHPAFDTKLGGLFWCSQHEMIHAGQIGLIRRLRGKKPLR